MATNLTAATKLSDYSWTKKMLNETDTPIDQAKALSDSGFTFGELASYADRFKKLAKLAKIRELDARKMANWAFAQLNPSGINISEGSFKLDGEFVAGNKIVHGESAGDNTTVNVAAGADVRQIAAGKNITQSQTGNAKNTGTQIAAGKNIVMNGDKMDQIPPEGPNTVVLSERWRGDFNARGKNVIVRHNHPAEINSANTVYVIGPEGYVQGEVWCKRFVAVGMDASNIHIEIIDETY